MAVNYVEFGKLVVDERFKKQRHGNNPWNQGEADDSSISSFVAVDGKAPALSSSVLMFVYTLYTNFAVSFQNFLLLPVVKRMLKELYKSDWSTHTFSSPKPSQTVS